MNSCLDFENFKLNYGIDFEVYFSTEIELLKPLEDDGLVELLVDRVQLTEIGRDFVQRIMNIFDVYDPPGKSMHDRLETVKIAKEQQKMVQDRASK